MHYMDLITVLVLLLLFKFSSKGCWPGVTLVDKGWLEGDSGTTLPPPLLAFMRPLTNSPFRTLASSGLFIF